MPKENQEIRHKRGPYLTRRPFQRGSRTREVLQLAFQKSKNCSSSSPHGEPRFPSSEIPYQEHHSVAHKCQIAHEVWNYRESSSCYLRIYISHYSN